MASELDEECPRCGGPLRRGALSRSDNLTTICVWCGEDEAAVWFDCESVVDLRPEWIADGREDAIRKHPRAVDPKRRRFDT